MLLFQDLDRKLDTLVLHSSDASEESNEYKRYVRLEVIHRYIVNLIVTLRASGAVAQCIVIGSVCVCLWVCYHNNLKLRASILTKLGL